MKKTLAILLTTLIALSCAFAQGSKEGNAPKKTELNIMMSFPQYMEQWETYCRQFEEKILKEENIKLTINLEMPGSSDYESVLQARLTGGDAPDLFTLHSNNIATYYKAGNLLDLTAQEATGKVYPDVKAMVTYEDKVFALPLESQAWCVLYNKDIFNKYNLEVPETLDDLKNICKVLKANGVTPFELAFQEQWVPQLMTAVTLGGKVSAEIPDWVDRMNAGKGSYREVAEIFEVIRLIMDNGTPRAMEQGSETGAAAFAIGDAAMFVQGTWASGTIMNTNPNMNLGVLALPINNNPDCTRVNLSVSTTLAVHPNTKNKDLALKFINYVLDDTDSSALFQACSFNPLASCHTYEVASWVTDAYDYVAAGKSYKDLILPSAVTNEQGKLLQELYVGSVTVDEIIIRLDSVYKTAVKN